MLKTVIDESKTPGSAGEIIGGWIRLDLAAVQSAISIAFIDCQPLRGANNRNTSGFAGGFLLQDRFNQVNMTVQLLQTTKYSENPNVSQ